MRSHYSEKIFESWDFDFFALDLSIVNNSKSFEDPQRRYEAHRRRDIK